MNINAFMNNYINNGKVRSILICQIRLISSKRLIRKMGRVTSENFIEIKKQIRDFL